jgi:molecular chaperone DnaK (HSP70)
MYLLTVGQIRRPVGRQAHQQMTESPTGTNLDQSRRLGRRGRIRTDSEPMRSAPRVIVTTG